MNNLGDFGNFLAALNGILWHEYVMFVIVGTGLLFTIWSGFSQYRALTHGPKVVRGVYDDPDDPGAINHFQALSAALSATVGLGNIGGVALAIALGGPGAIFWMWVVGLLGMAIKLTEVTLSMLYRNVDDPDNPHGGPMWVVTKAVANSHPHLRPLASVVAVIFCVTLTISSITGGNMFQAWNVAELTHEYFGVPTWISGTLLAIMVGAVIIGGIRRIGLVAGTLVPFMCALYLIAGSVVLFINISDIPAMLVLIVKSAFVSTEAAGAFVGGTAASAFLYGMKRATFSNEAGQGSSPIAHSAAKTDEPVREGIVAGLEPFIDTIVVCTFTALIILSTGIWNRGPDVAFDTLPAVAPVEGAWQFETLPAPDENWKDGEKVILVLQAHVNPDTGFNTHRIEGMVSFDDGRAMIHWEPFEGPVQPSIAGGGFYKTYIGATLTSKAFDSVVPGLGKWLVTIAAWLFAVSTMISWAYYGEQGVVFLSGDKGVLVYKVVYLALAVTATLGLIESDTDLDNLTGVGTGVLVCANIPITLVFGWQAMRAYHEYIGRLKTGRMGPDHPPPTIEDLLSGRDVEKRKG